MSTLDLRSALGALSTASTGASFGNLTGVFPGGTSGAGVSDDLRVTPDAGLRVRAQPGSYGADRGANGLFIGAATAVNTAALDPANPSNPRIDYIVVRNRDPAGIDQNTNAADAGMVGPDGLKESAKLIALTGAPTSVPVGPENRLESGDVPLAAVTVRAGATSIAASDVTELRRFIVARGGIRPRVPGDNRPGSYEGEYCDNLAYNQLERWSGTAWEAVATPAVWTQYTPQLYASGSRTQVNLGNGGQYTGRFQLVGRRLDFTLDFKWGSPPWNGGYGPICSYLPKHPVTGTQLYGVGIPQWGQAFLTTNTSAYKGDFNGLTLVEQGSTRVVPYFGICHGHFPPNFPVDMNTDPYMIASAAGRLASGVPRIFNPNGLPEGGRLTCTASIECTWN